MQSHTANLVECVSECVCRDWPGEEAKAMTSEVAQRVCIGQLTCMDIPALETKKLLLTGD